MILFVVAFTMIYTEFSKYELLPGDDPAYWIKVINEFYTSLVQNHIYPSDYYRAPFFPLIGTLLLAILGDVFLATMVTVSLAYALYGYTSFLIGREIFKNREFIFLLTFLAMFPFYPQVTPIDMLGWGGYYQILALPFINLELYFTIRLVLNESHKGFRWNILGVSLGILLVFSSHVPSGVFALADAFICIIIYFFTLGFKEKFKRREIVYTTLILVSIALFSYLLFKEYILRTIRAAFADHVTYRTYDYRSLSVLNSKILVLVLIIIIPSSIILFPWWKKIFELKIRRNIILISIILVYFLIPVIFSYSLLYIFRFSTDYNRISYFLWIPVITLFAYNLDLLIVWFKKVKNKIDNSLKLLTRKNLTRLIKSIEMGIITYISVISVFTSTTHFKSVTNYFSISHDRDSLNLINWIKENTDPNETILAPEGIGRWIKSISGNSVISSRLKYYVYSELTDKELADLLYTSKFMIRNGYVRVKFYAQGNSLYSPGIQFYYKGCYEEAIWIRDDFIFLNFSYTIGDGIQYDTNWISVLPKKKFILTNNETLGNLTVLYTKKLLYNKTLVQIRQIILEKGSPFVTVKLHLEVLGEKIRIDYLNFSIPQIAGVPAAFIESRLDGQLWGFRMFDNEILPILVSFNPDPNDTHITFLDENSRRYIASSIFSFQEFQDSVDIEIRIQLNENPVNVYSPTLEDRESPIIAANVTKYINMINYIVVPKEYMRSFWLPSYYWYLKDFFVHDYRFTVIYENRKWILFKI